MSSAANLCQKSRSRSCSRSSAQGQPHASDLQSAPGGNDSKFDEQADKFASAASLGSGAVMPLLPATFVPARTRVTVMVPIRMRMAVKATLADVRARLAAAGIAVDGRQLFFRGDPEDVDETLPLAEIKDLRFVLFPETGLLPWQLCAAHRACERLVHERLAGNWAAAVARNPMYKTRLCNHWVMKGSCPRADRCVYAHGSAELRPSQAPSVVRGQHGATPSPAAPSSGQSSASAKVPEVVFTVDKEEERRRAERAKRFAPRQKASFEAEEKAPPPEHEPAVEAEGAAFDDMGLNEDQIADYLFEMQQHHRPLLARPPGAGLPMRWTHASRWARCRNAHLSAFARQVNLGLQADLSPNHKELRPAHGFVEQRMRTPGTLDQFASGEPCESMDQDGALQVIAAMLQDISTSCITSDYFLAEINRKCQCTWSKSGPLCTAMGPV
eukprot:s5559_g8.t1